MEKALATSHEGNNMPGASRSFSYGQ